MEFSNFWECSLFLVLFPNGLDRDLDTTWT